MTKHSKAGQSAIHSQRSDNTFVADIRVIHGTGAAAIHKNTAIHSAMLLRLFLLFSSIILILIQHFLILAAKLVQRYAKFPHTQKKCKVRCYQLWLRDDMLKSNSFCTKNEKNEPEFKIILYFCKQNVVFVHEVQSSGLTKHLQLTIVRLKSSNLV